MLILSMSKDGMFDQSMFESGYPSKPSSPDDAWMTVDGENNLDTLMAGAEVKDPKNVDQEKLKLLMKECKWVGTGYEFLYMVSKSTSEVYRPSDGTVVLGLSNFYEVTQAVGVHTEAELWPSYYYKNYWRMERLSR